MGVVLNYGIKGTVPEEFDLAENNCSMEERYFSVGQAIQVNTKSDNFLCSVSGKVFKDAKGNSIRSTVRVMGGKGEIELLGGGGVSRGGVRGKGKRRGKKGEDKGGEDHGEGVV